MEWNSNLYDQKHDFVSRYGEDVIELLAPQTGEYILDLGCGTGDLTELIRTRGADVIGIDNSVEMIHAAQKKYPHINFQLKSAVDYVSEETFDGIFSNATLHWVLEPEKAVHCIYKSLKHGGRFVAEFGGKDNVSTIVNALKRSLMNNGYQERAQKEVWYFPSISEYTTLLEQNGFRVTFAALFERDTLLKDSNGIKNWVKMFGAPYLQDLEPGSIEAVINDVEHEIRPTNFKNGSWYADYKRLRVIALKI